MSSFLELYGTELTRELAASSTDPLFTTARRKAAINAGQLEFVERTECLRTDHVYALADEDQEVDLESIAAAPTTFLRIGKQGVSIRIVGASSTRYIEGDDLVETSVARLNQEEPGWRAVSSGTPRKYYQRNDGGGVYLGLHPKVNVGAGETWSAIVSVVLMPTDMSADADVPFTVGANPLGSLRWCHRALAHFAAHDLEKLRKDLNRSAMQLQLFDGYVQRYNAAQTPKGGQSVRFARDYRGRRHVVRDLRVWP